jgi:hypothetical protein
MILTMELLEMVITIIAGFLLPLDTLQLGHNTRKIVEKKYEKYTLNKAEINSVEGTEMYSTKNTIVKKEHPWLRQVLWIFILLFLFKISYFLFEDLEIIIAVDFGLVLWFSLIVTKNNIRWAELNDPSMFGSMRYLLIWTGIFIGLELGLTEGLSPLLATAIWWIFFLPLRRYYSWWPARITKRIIPQ